MMHYNTMKLLIDLDPNPYWNGSGHVDFHSCGCGPALPLFRAKL